MNAKEWYASGKFGRSDGLDIFFKREGKGEVLWCIHGFPTSSWDFEAIWPDLVNRFDVIAHDLVGLGRSSKPKQPLPVSLQADVIEVLAEEQGIEEAHILAHDLGDTVAQELLARFREGRSKVRWRSCVFLNGGIFPETHHARPIQKLLLSPLGPLLTKLTSKRTFVKTFNKIFSPAHPPAKSFIDQSWDLMVSDNGRSMLPRLIRYMVERKTNRERWVAPLVGHTVPIRLINGVDDPVSGRHAADRFMEVVPNGDVVYLENSGHYPHVETPREVLDAFWEFHDALPVSPSLDE
jgi:pimeloyl-ACP methyl ester carboxylesterase